MHHQGRRPWAIAGVSCAVLAAGAGTASGAPIAGIQSLVARPHVVRLGRTAKLSGSSGNRVAGTPVTLYARPFPYRSRHVVARTTTDAGGRFMFRIRPDRDTRFRAKLAGGGATNSVQIDVLAKAPARARALALGRARVSIVVYHPRGLRWGHRRVSWSFASAGARHFTAATPTRSVRLSPFADRLTTVVTLPAGRFRWRACMRVPGAGALLDPRRPRGCKGRGYHGSGSLPVGFPAPNAVARAAAYLRGRTGRTAFAVVDSEGRLSGVRMHWTFVSASLVKAMLLVAYLRMLDARGQHRIDAYSNSFLYPMIHLSDNDAATQTWSIVGDGRLYALAHAAHMTDYSVVGDWAQSQVSAADQARFFFEMNSLIPPEFRRYARFLLSTITEHDSWGIPAVARLRGYQVWFKGGWRDTELGQLVHQVARVEGHDRTFSVAVMTDADPSMGYGIDTIQGVTGALLQ